MGKAISNKKLLFIIGLLLAAALGTFLPQVIVGGAQSAPEEVTYDFFNLGMTTQQSRTQVKEILEYVVGVRSVSFMREGDHVRISFQHELMKPEWIMKTLKAHGFSPKGFNKVKE
jgi:hypothetical protein